jgi:hypothetical protein
MSGAEPVGTLAEEAAKLFAVLHGWLGDEGGDHESRPSSQQGSDSNPGGCRHDPVEERLRTEPAAAECRWCPLCQLARMARATSPDVREHLTQAATSLALAVKGLLEDPAETARRSTPLEKIDLTEE